MYDVAVKDFIHSCPAGSPDTRTIPKKVLPELEVLYHEFFIRTSRLVRLIPGTDVTAPAGLKRKIYGVSRFKMFLKTIYDHRDLALDALIVSRNFFWFVQDEQSQL